MEPVPSTVIDRIRDAVGPKGWVADPAEIEPYLLETRGSYRGATALVVRPGSTREVAEVVRICAEARIPIVPQGGNTGLCGGAVPGEDGRNILLSLTRMNRIRAIDPLDYTMTVEAGCILADIQKAAAEIDRHFPLSLGAEGSCCIGGNISTNAGGIAVLRYGSARDLVLGLEVVLPDGRIWDGLRALRKDNTGYDLKQLFIGCEGTLGIITAAVLKLFPRPRAIETAFLALRRIDEVMEVFARVRAATGDTLTAFELIPRIGLDFALRHITGIRDPIAGRHPFYVLLETASSRDGDGLRPEIEALLADLLAEGMVEDGILAATLAQARDLWRIREGIVLGQSPEGGSIKHDVSVPVGRIAEFITRTSAAVEAALPGIRIVAFGHVGDGNVHFNLTQPIGADRANFLTRRAELNRIVHGHVAALGGSISAEHGIGRLKRDELGRYKSPVEIDLMRRIKAALDPEGLLNPGKVLP
jgi:FAD/FMN-containing dehydrogenase